MPKGDFTPLLKTYESSLERAASKHKVYNDFLENISVDINDNLSYEEKLKLWTKMRIEVKKAKNDVGSLAKHLQSEREKLSEIYESSTRSSPFIELLDNLEIKYDPTDLLNSLREINIELENTITEIDEYVLLTKELFNQRAHQDTTSRRLDLSPVNTRSRRPQIQLQAIEVSLFDGKPENYPEFIAVFDELVNQNVDFSHLQKAMYLKRALRGDAARCIEGIPATGENYARLLNKITARYSNALVNQHGIMRKLENIARATDNSLSCEQTFNDIDVILNQLTSTGLDLFESWDPMWQRIILRKFPESMAEKILLDSHDKINYTINEIMNSLRKLIFGKHFLEESGFSNFSHMKNETMRIGRNHMSSYNIEQAKPRIIERNSPNTVQQNKYYPAPLCIFCPNQQQHSSENCLLPLRDKRNYLNESRSCWKCFESNHTSFECSLPNCCCGGQHNSSLCKFNQAFGNIGATYNQISSARYNNNGGNNTHNYSRGNSQTQEGINSPTSRNTSIPYQFATHRSEIPRVNHVVITPGGEEKIAPSSDTNNLQAHHLTVAKEITRLTLPILMTCEAPVFNADINRYVESTLFFDSGAQCTLVSEKFAKMMKLKILSRERYLINGVSNKGETVNGHKVELRLKDSDGQEKVITALTKPSLSEGFNAAKLEANDLHFLDENKVNKSNCHINGQKVYPDILIGADYYNQLVKNEPSIELPSGLRIISTVFGNTIFAFANKTKNISLDEVTFANHSCIITRRGEKERTHGKGKVVHKVHAIGKGRANKKQSKAPIPNIQLGHTAEIIKRPTLPKEVLQLLKRRASFVKQPKRTVAAKRSKANEIIAGRIAHLRLRAGKIHTSDASSKAKEHAVLKVYDNNRSKRKRTLIQFAENQQPTMETMEKDNVNAIVTVKGTESGKLIH